MVELIETSEENENVKKLNNAIEAFVDFEIKTKTLPLFEKLGINIPKNYKQNRVDNVREQMFESSKKVRDIMLSNTCRRQMI